MHAVLYLCFFVIVIISIIYIYEKKYKFTLIESSDGQKYNVLRFKDRKQAAEKLSMINRNMVKLVTHLKQKYTINRKTKNTMVKRILERYNPDVLYEHKPNFFENNVAFTKNKGESIYICLRDNNNQLHDDNTLMFVAIHEVSHIATKVRDHKIEFWQTFKWLINESKEAGAYIPIDYSVFPTKYCGSMSINYNPYFDDRIEMPKA